jgi:hypothetical protein
MAARFEDYRALLDMGVPKEDARFVLPYCLRSNFYMTLDARELIGLICAMLWGRGPGFGEIEALGRQLRAQFDAIYPGVIDSEAARYPKCAPMALPEDIHTGSDRAGDAGLLNAFDDASGFLKAMCAFTGRQGMDIPALLTDARPRELELVGYTFRVKRVSLACVTHFTRHRMVSLLVPPVARGLADGDYVLPETVSANPEAEALYRRAFQEQAEAAQRALALGDICMAAGCPIKAIRIWRTAAQKLLVMDYHWVDVPLYYEAYTSFDHLVSEKEGITLGRRIDKAWHLLGHPEMATWARHMRVEYREMWLDRYYEALP